MSGGHSFTRLCFHKIFKIFLKEKELMKVDWVWFKVSFCAPKFWTKIFTPPKMPHAPFINLELWADYSAKKVASTILGEWCISTIFEHRFFSEIRPKMVFIKEKGDILPKLDQQLFLNQLLVKISEVQES